MEYYITATYPIELKKFELKKLTNKPITVWTFEWFFDEWHRINRTRKIDKARCREYWQMCNFEDRKKSAIKDITKTDLTAFEYLKTKLK
jgi:hypothetical protein